MRTTNDDATVRLYHLDRESGAASTLVYSSLARAIALAAEQPKETRGDLFIQTENDVIAYLDLVEN